MNLGIFGSHEVALSRGFVLRRQVFFGNVGSSVSVNWQRPRGVTHVRVELTGGGGGGDNVNPGGTGGRGSAILLLPVGLGLVQIVAGAGANHLVSNSSASSFGNFVTGTGGGLGGGNGSFSVANGAVIETSGIQPSVLGPNAGTPTAAGGGGNPGAVAIEYVQQIEAGQ